MKTNLKRTIIKGILGGIVIPLSSCYGNVIDCGEEDKHAHEVVSESYGIRFYHYFGRTERDVYERIYKTTDNIIKLTKEDERFFRFLETKNLTELTDDSGRDFLYRQMKNNVHDTISFYFEYYTEEEVTETDSEGNKTTKTERVHHDGWSPNPRHPDNTGHYIIYHTRFRLSDVMKEDGSWVAKEIIVDDPQKYWDEYHYFNYPTAFKNDNNLVVVQTEIKWTDRYKLPDLDADKEGGFSHIDTTTEGYQNWLNGKKSSMIDTDEISFLEQNNIETISLYPSKQKVLVYTKNN